MSYSIRKHRYGTEDSQYIDLYVPVEPLYREPLVLIHGGWWKAKTGNEQSAPLARDLAERGYIVCNLEFRRVGNGGGWPVTFCDVCTALDSLPDLIDEDATGFIAIGFSSGGHLALLASARRRDELAALAPVGSESVVPAQVISLAGIADLSLAHKLNVGPDAAVNFLGDVVAGLQEADPVHYLPAACEHVLVHGERDINGPITISRSYVDRAADPLVRLVAFPEADHFTFLDPASQEWAEIVGALICPT